MWAFCSGVVDERPFAAVVLVADDNVEGGEYGQEKSLELQESMTPVGGPVGISERATRTWEGRRGSPCYPAFSTSTMLLDASSAAEVAGWKRKKKFSNSRRELGQLDALNWTSLGAALDAGERSGPRWTGDAWLARRRRYSTARRDRVMT